MLETASRVLPLIFQKKSMFSSIRRHQKWLWIVVSFFVIVSFVVYFSPNVGLGSSGAPGGEVALGTIDGKPIQRDTYLQAYNEARLRFRMYNGDWPNDAARARQMGFDLDNEAQTRLVMLARAKDLGIAADETAVADWIANSFQDRNSPGFKVERYQQFIDTVLKPAGYSAADFEQFVRNELAVQHLVFLGGLNGRLVTPLEAEAKYREANEEIETEAVFFSASNHIASVTVTPTALDQFFTNNMATYRIPERLVVHYVQFEATNFIAAAEVQMAGSSNLLASIDQVYLQRGPAAYPDAQGKPLPPDQAKARIREELRGELSMREARRAAAAFADELFSQPQQGDQLPRLAAAKGIQHKTTAPFDRNGPIETPDSFLLARAAFSLSAEEPFSNPQVGQDQVYVLALSKKIPSELPSLEQIRARVTEDYRNRQALDAARLTGTGYQTTLSNSIAQGKSFASAVAGPFVAYMKLPPFSRSTRTLPDVERKASLSQLKDVGFALAVGKTSPFTQTREGGFILHLTARKPVDEAKMKTELPEFTRNLQRSHQYDAFNEWLRKERERLVLPATSQQRAAGQ